MFFPADVLAIGDKIKPNQTQKYAQKNTLIHIIQKSKLKTQF